MSTRRATVANRSLASSSGILTTSLSAQRDRPLPQHQPGIIMQDSRQEGGSGSSKQKRNHLPTLAPRDAKPAPTRERAPQSSSTTGRTPRLSHRSRAGCWTCRGRKVKCDEARKYTDSLIFMSDYVEDLRVYSKASLSTYQGRHASFNLRGIVLTIRAID